MGFRFKQIKSAVHGMMHFAVVATLATSAGWVSQTASGAEYDGLKNAFEKGLASCKDPLETLNQGYEGALKRLADAAKQQGDLEALLIIQEEATGYRSGPAKDIAKTPPLARTRQIYEKNRSLRLAEIQTKIEKHATDYIHKLDALIVDLTKQGKLDEAVITKKEAERILVLKANPQMLASVLLKIDTAAATTTPAEPPAVAATMNRFVPLNQRPSGTLHFQGAGHLGERAGKLLLDQREDFIEVLVSWNRWIALKKDGSVIGAPTAEAAPPADLKPAISLKLGANTNIAFHADGTATAWGRFKNPALDTPPADLGPVRDFAAAEMTGLAAMPDGSLRVWGSVYPDQAARQKIQTKIKDVALVAAAGDISWVVTESGKIYRWRNKKLDPIIVGRASGIVKLAASYAGVAVLTDKGKVEGWDMWPGGLASQIPSGLKGAKNIEASWSSLVIQKEDGTWHGGGTKHPQLAETITTFDAKVIDVAMGSWTTNGLIGWIVKNP